METKNLNKSLLEIFQSKYIVPLYQRNYAWKEEEIAQLLQDLYENFKKAEAQPRENGEYALNYFIGSLVVLKRKDGYYEVIDGQQRLTTLSILLKVLDLIKEPKLFYESRPEVEAFFDSYYRDGNTMDVTFDYKVSHLVNAVDLIKESIINPDEHKQKRLFDIDNLEGFKKFVMKNVILVRVEIPQDTDVAAYFEIMNNRGEQLQKHEILKSYLMETLKDSDGNYFEKKQDEFSKIWDVCSQMDTHVQKLFSAGDRAKYFGGDYDGFIKPEINSIEATGPIKTTGFSINDAIDSQQIKLSTDNIDDIDDSGKDQSIIDFPNFLMHIFKVKYKTYLDNGKETEIPLNEKDLISVYEGLEKQIDAVEFIEDLLYYRVVFDKFIVKSSEDEKDDDKYHWTLQKPYRYFYQKKESSSLKYRTTFDNQDRLIKSISLLQVTFRNRKYKNWLQDIFVFFADRTKLGVSKSEYQSVIDGVMLNYFENHINNSNYDAGVKVPHFLFNFIDYLYWVKSPANFNFKFTYRNSVEHHLPQSYKSEINENLLDNLGNLCLVSKSSNSKMNNEHPVGKAAQDGKYYKGGMLPPKQRLIYDITNLLKRWETDEIIAHRSDVESLLNERNEILKFSN